MKKEFKEKGQPREAQEIELFYQPGKMTFRVGGQEFYLLEEVAMKLFGRPVQIEFEKLAGRDESFGELKSLENFVRIQRLLAKGLGLDLIAKVLGRPQELIRSFFNAETNYPSQSYDANSLELERQGQAAEEMDFIHEAQRPAEMADLTPSLPKLKFVNLLDVLNLRRQGLSDQGVGLRLGLDPAEFFRFLELNRRYLDLLP